MSPLESNIILYISNNSLCSSKEIHDGIIMNVGYATVKRSLAKLLEQNYIITQGKGRGTKYEISKSYGILRPIDVNEYFADEIDERTIKSEFDFELIPHILTHINLFSQEELSRLNSLQEEYQLKVDELSDSQFNKELERLAIDLSWKSSQIEGNTYSLLETERLLREQQTAEGKHRDEATMLLNHKKALDFILSNPDYVHPIEIRRIEDIHSLLMKDLDVERNIRTRKVGISGTNYTPLDNEYQIREALLQVCTLVNLKQNVFEKALLIIMLLSYIQAFSDGNKRTGRIVTNACLISHGYCPMSFRTVNSLEYKKAMLIFYEQHNVSAFKTIFMDQFEFAVQTYF